MIIDYEAKLKLTKSIHCLIMVFGRLLLHAFSILTVFLNAFYHISKLPLRRRLKTKIFENNFNYPCLLPLFDIVNFLSAFKKF